MVATRKHIAMDNQTLQSVATSRHARMEAPPKPRRRGHPKIAQVRPRGRQASPAPLLRLRRLSETEAAARNSK
jgi:hypothetical protein